MIHEIIRKRRSTVLFYSQPIDNEILLELFFMADLVIIFLFDPFIPIA
jgi:hypothetical protein